MVQAPWPAFLSTHWCITSHLQLLSKNSVPDIPLEHFTPSSSSFSRPLAQSPISCTWFNFLQRKVCKECSWEPSACPALRLRLWFPGCCQDLPWATGLAFSQVPSQLFLPHYLSDLHFTSLWADLDQATPCEDFLWQVPAGPFHLFHLVVSCWASYKVERSYPSYRWNAWEAERGMPQDWKLTRLLHDS